MIEEGLFFSFFNTLIINQNISSIIRTKLLTFLENLYTSPASRTYCCIWGYFGNHLDTACLFLQDKRMAKKSVTVMYKNANTFMLPTKMDNNLDAAKTNCFPVYSAIYVTKKKKKCNSKNNYYSLSDCQALWKYIFFVIVMNSRVSAFLNIF